ncbi:MAG: DUF1285 domain-containing protein [Alphaproteobacteria bacterium]
MTGNTSRPTGDDPKIGLSSPSDQPSGSETPPSCGDFDIRIARDGTWFHQGSPIGRKSLVRLFASVLRREADGEFWLVTPAERGRVIVDDAPFVAVELAASGTGSSQTLHFRTNIDDWVVADAAHPIRVAQAADSGAPSPYILVRDGLEALIARSAYYHLVELAVEREEGGVTFLGVWSRETFFPLGSLE